jgi:hypothetical protein
MGPMCGHAGQLVGHYIIQCIMDIIQHATAHSIAAYRMYSSPSIHTLSKDGYAHYLHKQSGCTIRYNPDSVKLIGVLNWTKIKMVVNIGLISQFCCYSAV